MLRAPYPFERDSLLGPLLGSVLDDGIGLPASIGVKRWHREMFCEAMSKTGIVDKPSHASIGHWRNGTAVPDRQNWQAIKAAILQELDEPFLTEWQRALDEASRNTSAILASGGRRYPVETIKKAYSAERDRYQTSSRGPGIVDLWFQLKEPDPSDPLGIERLAKFSPHDKIFAIWRPLNIPYSCPFERRWYREGQKLSDELGPVNTNHVRNKGEV